MEIKRKFKKVVPLPDYDDLEVPIPCETTGEKLRHPTIRKATRPGRIPTSRGSTNVKKVVSEAYVSLKRLPLGSGSGHVEEKDTKQPRGHVNTTELGDPQPPAGQTHTRASTTPKSPKMSGIAVVTQTLPVPHKARGCPSQGRKFNAWSSVERGRIPPKKIKGSPAPGKNDVKRDVPVPRRV